MSERQELLEMRLDALKQDIDTVKQVVDAAKRRGLQLEQIRQEIGRRGTVMAQLPTVKSTMTTLADMLRMNADLLKTVRELNPLLPQQVGESLPALEQIHDGLRRANETLDDIDKTFVNLDNKSDLQTTLDERCEAAAGKLKVIRDKLGHEPLRSLWSAYEVLVETDCRPLFTEYVDFLGGLTLRDTALDGGVCSMTDRLLELYDGTGRSLAVPAHPQSIGDAMRLVKLGFPEWTFWSVPLVGQDVGLAFARGQNVMAGFGEFVTQARSQEFVQRLIADAFAVYTLGLSYGCAAVILRFQPHHDDGNPNTPSDVQRARMVLEMLRLLEPDPAAPLSESADLLEEHWTEAVQQLTDGDVDRPAWLLELAGAAFELCQTRVAFEPFDGVRYANGLARRAADLLAEPADHQAAEVEHDPLAGPGIAAAPHNDAATVLELLNTAWGLRLAEPRHTASVTRNIDRLWFGREEPVDVGRGRPQVRPGPASGSLLQRIGR